MKKKKENETLDTSWGMIESIEKKDRQYEWRYAFKE